MDSLGASRDFLAQQYLFDHMDRLRNDRHLVVIRHFNGYFSQHVVARTQNRLSTLQNHGFSMQRDVLMKKVLCDNAANPRGLSWNHASPDVQDLLADPNDPFLI